MAAPELWFLFWSATEGPPLQHVIPLGIKSRVRSQLVCSCTNRNAAAMIARDCAVSLNPSNP